MRHWGLWEHRMAASWLVQRCSVLRPGVPTPPNTHTHTHIHLFRLYIYQGAQNDSCEEEGCMKQMPSDPCSITVSPRAPPILETRNSMRCVCTDGDCIDLSRELIDRLITSTSVTALYSEHSAITFTLCTDRNAFGKGYWKLNNSVLNDIEYLKGIIESYEVWMKKRF